jgi:hypothetical protein
MRERLFAVRFAVAAAGLCVATPLAMASLVRALDLAGLTTGADRIVVADVLSVQAAWDAAHRTIHTAVEVSVRESWKGETPAGGRLTIRQLGGTVGEIEMTVRGMARFAVGERTLLFLRRSQVMGMSQGKRSLRWEPIERRWLVDPADHSEVVTIDRNGGLRAVGAGRAEALDSLRDKVGGLLGK